MLKQKDIFLTSEGDAWFERNKNVYDTQNIDSDVLVDFIQKQELSPKNVLEIGCANGSRLSLINKKFNSKCTGVDVSTKAILEGKKKFSYIDLHVESADNLNFPDESFDLVIIGFCLYLCDRKDLFTIAAQIDRVLCDGGYILIQDFHSPVAYKNEYVHHKGLFSYKMDNSQMFTWNPAYTLFALELDTHTEKSLRIIPDERVAISLIHKDLENAYSASLSYNNISK